MGTGPLNPEVPAADLTGEILRQLAAQREILAALASQQSELLFDDDRKRVKEQSARPLPLHLGEYRQQLLSRGDGPRHVEQTIKRVRLMLRLCRAPNTGRGRFRGVHFWSELTKSGVTDALGKLRAPRPHRPKRKSRGLATVNHYFHSLKGFCGWLVDDTRVDRSPLRGMKPFAASLDVRVKRRALTPDDLRELVNAAIANGPIVKIPGYERAMMYILATATGLRLGELKSLSRSSFQLDGPEPYVTIEAAYSRKHKRTVNQPIPARRGPNGESSVADLMREYLKQLDRDDRIFRTPANGTYALKKDLKLAGIPYIVLGERADNHAQRHTFVSDLFTSGATPKEAQTLARHVDPRLTLSRYAHVTPAAQRAAVERLPSPASGLTPSQRGLVVGFTACWLTARQPDRGQ